jgi:hypothetical protein
MQHGHTARAGATDPDARGYPSRPTGQEGSTLLLALLILGALTILATTAVVTSMGDRNLSRYDRHAAEAMSAAETGIAFAKRAIVDRTASLGDDDDDGRPDFELSDTLSWGGSYDVVAETSDIKGMGITAYQSNGFTIVSEGDYLGAKRRVKVEIVHDTFLKFARFVSQNDLNYGCGAAVSGEVYTGGNLGVACGCGSGNQDKFLEDVYVVGTIPNVSCADFYRGYVTGADTIDLSNSFDWTEVRNKARGLSSDNSCERLGSVGIYTSLAGTDPMNLAVQASPNTNVLVLDRLDFNNTTLFPPDTVITYNNVAVINPLTGAALRRSAFNGILYFDGQAQVRGTMDGISARSVTIFGSTTVLVRGNIITGHTGFDPITRLPNGSGDPVNIGLVAEGQIMIHSTCPRVLRIDAAFLSRTSNWKGYHTSSAPADNPPAVGNYPSLTGMGPLDLDLDGIIGETPHNNDPMPGQGWDEVTITDRTWVLNINGPIITTATGDAYPWNCETHIVPYASGPTRRYNYDMDVTSFPPPCFPVPLNLWNDVSWSEIFEVSPPLTDYLPN